MIKVVVEGLKIKLVVKNKQSWQKRTREKNEEIVKVVEKMNKAEIKVLRYDEQKIERELVLKEKKVYIRVEDNKICLFYFYFYFYFIYFLIQESRVKVQ